MDEVADAMAEDVVEDRELWLWDPTTAVAFYNRA